MKKIKILVYVREYLKFNYLPLFAAVPDAEIEYLTDFPTRGMHNIRDMFYEELEHQDPERHLPFDVNDVVIRCRLLRQLDPIVARLMAGAMYNVMKRVVRPNEHSVVVGQIVDDYLTHLLSIVATQAGVKYIGLCSSFFPGYTQISQFTNGIAVNGRDVDASEAQVLVSTIAKRNFRMDYTQPKNYSLLPHIKRVLRYQFKEFAFAILKRYRRDPKNYHYTVQKYLAQPKNIFNFPAKASFHQDWESRISGTTRRRVYLPLGVFPEASTDYWVPSLRLLDYDEAVCSMAIDLSKENQVIIKEHVHMLGIRDQRLYARLRDIPNVVSVPPEIISNTLLEDFKPTILVGAGSVGVEATLRQLPVVTFSPTSYWFGPSEATYASADSNDQICAAVKSARGTDKDPVEFIRECLQCMVPFDFMLAPTVPKNLMAQIRPFLTA